MWSHILLKIRTTKSSHCQIIFHRPANKYTRNDKMILLFEQMSFDKIGQLLITRLIGCKLTNCVDLKKNETRKLE